MRKLLALFAIAALVLVGGSATAAPVNVNATIHLSLGDFGFSIAGPGGTVSVTGAPGFTFGGVSGSNLVFSPGLVQQPTTATLPVNVTTLIDSVIIYNDVGNGAGTLSIGGATPSEVCGDPADACVSGGGLGGIVPILGNIDASTLIGPPIPLDLTGLQLGVGGPFAMPTSVGNMTGNAGQWTTGTASVSTVANGELVTASGGNDGSTMTLVSPTYVSILSGTLEIPVIATLTLEVVPEPGTLLLIGTGVAGLALVGRNRRK